jgi:iron(III) transport system substrate-binding protein
MKVRYGWRSALLVLLAMVPMACGSGSGEQPTTGIKDATNTSALEAAAKKEGTVTVYMVDTWIPWVKKGFETTYPWANFQAFGGSVPNIKSKFLIEAQAGTRVGEVVFGFPSDIKDYQNAGAVAAVKVANDSQLPAAIQDPNSVYHASIVSPALMIYNTNLLKASDLPTDLFDLAQPIWKNKLAMDNPLHGSGSALFLASTRKDWGDDKWNQWLAGLKANNVLLTQDSGSAYAAVLRGDRPLCVGCAYSNYLLQKPGTPMAITQLPIAVSPFVMYIAAKAPHPNMAALFVNWMLGATEGQQALSDNGHLPAVPLTTPGALALPAGVPVVPLDKVKDYLADSAPYVAIYGKYWSL